MTTDRREFSDKLFMFPESYNELRKELTQNYPTLWRTVQGPMAYDASLFIQLMDAALDFKIGLSMQVSMEMPTSAVEGKLIDEICTRYLTELRKKRGHPNP